MRYILDTHVIIHALKEPERLPLNIQGIVNNKSMLKSINIVSLWEIVIKSSLGKLTMLRNIPEMINEITKNGFSILQIVPQHLIVLHGLEYFHRDPFDRIIISQAITENMEVVTSDELFNKYNVNLVKV